MISVYAMCGGLIDLDLSGFFCDRAPGSRATVPVICFLIAHPQGHVLVDTGVHRQALTDPVGRLGEGRAARFTLRSSPSDEMVNQLALLGLTPEHVRYVVNSHFHFDHCGGNEFFPRSAFLVQRPEMDAARQVQAGVTMRYSPSPIDFDHPLDYQLLDGERDIFGDGQVVLRSEERRVGKECRSRGSPYHKKKKTKAKDASGREGCCNQERIAPDSDYEPF